MEQVKNCKEPEEFEFYNTKDLLNKEVKVYIFQNTCNINHHSFGIFSQILELQNELKDQYVTRRELEKATVDPPLLHDPVNEDSLPKVIK